MAESSGSSVSSSSSTPIVLNTPQSDWGLQLSKLLAVLGDSQYKWAQGEYAKGSAITDQNIAQFMDMTGRGAGLAQNLIQQYEQEFAPLVSQYIAQAQSYNSEARQRFMMGRAGSQVAQADQAARDEAERKLQGFGINPSSGRYQDLLLSDRTRDAAARAGAETQAALDTADRGRAMTEKGIQFGQNVPGMAVNALNSAYTGITGAENAILGQLNTGANLTQSAAPFYNASNAANKLPSVGQQSSSGSASQQQSSSPSGSGNGSGSGSGKGSGSGSGGSGSGGSDPLFERDMRDSAAREAFDRQMQLEALRQSGRDGRGGGGGATMRGIGGGGSAGGGSGSGIINVGPYGGGQTPETGMLPPEWQQPSTEGTEYTPDNAPWGNPDDGNQGLDSLGSTNAGPTSLNDWNDPSGTFASGNGASQYDPSTAPWPDPAGGDQIPQDNGLSSGPGYNDFAFDQPTGSTDEYAEGGPVPRQGGVLPTSGGAVPRGASPSQGRQTDDIPARLNAGEYVIPRDVVAHQGTKFFANLIDKSRRMRTGMGGPRPGAKMKPPIQGRPSFVSRGM